MNTENRSRRTPYLAGVVLVIAGLLVGYWLMQRPTTHESPPPSSEAPGENTVARADGAGPIHNEVNEEPVLSPQIEEPGATPKLEEPDDDEPKFADVSLKVLQRVDRSEVPVPDISIKAAFADGRVETIQTDSHGKFQLTGPRGESVEVTLESPGWRFARPGRLVESRRVYFPDSKHGADTLRVAEVSECVFEFSYEDGVPYEGTVTFSPNPFGPGMRRQEVSDGKLTIDLTTRSYSGRALTGWKIQTPSRRPGFSTTEAEMQLPADNQSPMVITLPRRQEDAGNGRGVLEINFIADPEDTPVKLYVEPFKEAPGQPVAGRASYSQGKLPADLPHRTTPLSPGTYIVHAWSHITKTGSLAPPDPQLSGSQMVEILPGQTTHLRLTLRKAGSARALVVDAKGNPIPKARLARVPTPYVDWSRVKTKPAGYSQYGSFMYALADEHGVVTLPKLTPGTHELICDAEGCEHKVVTVYIESGLTYDVGRVELGDAPGRLVVEVTHDEVDENAEYEVRVMVSMGPTIKGPIRFEGKRAVIDKLPLGTFYISILYTAGGYGAHGKYVTLSENDPEGTVKFTMQKPPLKRE